MNDLAMKGMDKLKFLMFVGQKIYLVSHYKSLWVKSCHSDLVCLKIRTGERITSPVLLFMCDIAHFVCELSLEIISGVFFLANASTSVLDSDIFDPNNPQKKPFTIMACIGLEETS